MLDALHAVDYEAFDGLARVRVRQHVGAPVARRLHRGADLGGRGLQRVDRVEFRHDAAAAHDLDLRGAGLEVLARRHQGLVDAVRQDRAAVTEVRRPAFERRVGIVRRAEVTVARRLRDHGAGREQPRAVDEACFDRSREIRVRAAGVPYRREARVQVMLRHRGRGRARDRRVVFLHAARILAGQVRVQVDESRGKDAVIAVDDLGTVGDVDGIFRYRVDDAVDDQDVAGREFFVHAVEDANVLDEYRLRIGSSRDKSDQCGQ